MILRFLITFLQRDFPAENPNIIKYTASILTRIKCILQRYESSRRKTDKKSRGFLLLLADLIICEEEKRDII